MAWRKLRRSSRSWPRSCTRSWQGPVTRDVVVKPGDLFRISSARRGWMRWEKGRGRSVLLRAEALTGRRVLSPAVVESEPRGRRSGGKGERPLHSCRPPHAPPLPPHAARCSSPSVLAAVLSLFLVLPLAFLEPASHKCPAVTRFDAALVGCRRRGSTGG